MIDVAEAVQAVVREAKQKIMFTCSCILAHSDSRLPMELCELYYH